MFMTVRHYKVRASQIDEVVNRVDQNWLEHLRALPGYVSYHVVRPAEGELLSLTVFADKATAKVAAEASAEWVGERLGDLDVPFIDMHEGPVLVHGG